MKTLFIKIFLLFSVCLNAQVATKEYVYEHQGNGRDSWKVTEKDSLGAVVNVYMVYERPDGYAGTATASTAPLKLTSGTNLTTPENGAFEYNGTNLFFTRTGATRENIMTTGSVNTVSPTSPNRTITVVIDGVTYYIAAKTTND